MSYYKILINNKCSQIPLLLVLAMALTLGGCGGLPSTSPRSTKHSLSTRTEPTPQSSGQPQSRPAFTSPPSYCKAQVAADQAKLLEQFVVDTYNESMKDIAGFKPGVARDGTQPAVSFAVPGSPSFYHPKKRTEFHATLCDPKFFKCDKDTMQKAVAAHANSANSKDAYIKYYEKEGASGKYAYSAARNWGPLFIGIPLDPAQVRDGTGQIISGNLHVSLVKIYTQDQSNSETPDSKALKDKFAKALRDNLANLQTLLPDGIRLEAVSCSE